MGDESNLSGDGGVVKKITRKAKTDAVEPTMELPMGDESNLSGDGGVVKKIITKAKTDAIQPSKELPIVDVHYVAYLAPSNEVLCKTREDDEMFSFEIDAGSVIKGWDMAVKTMKVGEVATVVCKPEYAYGSAGAPPDVPENATLIFEVELMGCRPKNASEKIGGLSADDRAGLKKDLARMAEARSLIDLDAASRLEKCKGLEDAKKEKDKRQMEELGVDYELTGDGGVVRNFIWKAKADDATGPTNDLPIVHVYFSGFTIKLETGEVFRPPPEGGKISEEEKYVSFPFDTRFVMHGWDIALRTMKVGDIATITCKPEYAYKNRAGSPPDIPKNATLTSTLELVACTPFKKGQPPDNTINEKERLDLVRELMKQRELLREIREEEKQREKAAADAKKKNKGKLKKAAADAKKKNKGRSKKAAADAKKNKGGSSKGRQHKI